MKTITITKTEFNALTNYSHAASAKIPTGEWESMHPAMKEEMLHYLKKTLPETKTDITLYCVTDYWDKHDAIIMTTNKDN